MLTVQLRCATRTRPGGVHAAWRPLGDLLQESTYAIGELLATLTHVARLRAALDPECRRRWRVRAEIERVDLEQVAQGGAHGQLSH